MQARGLPESGGCAGDAGGAATASLQAHWKLDAIAAYAGERPLAWIDDVFDASCHAWAAARGVPTLLVSTAATRGLTSGEVEELMRFAHGLAARPPRAGPADLSSRPR